MTGYVLEIALLAIGLLVLALAVAHLLRLAGRAIAVVYWRLFR
jgi:hypothetical protein